jgi:putative ATP-binding cassette transporter
MHIIAFLRRITRKERWWLVGLTIVAGIANALLVVIVNSAAGLVANAGRPTMTWWVAFLGAFAVYLVCQKIALTRANAIVTRLLKQLRLDLVDKVRRAEMRTVDQVGRGELISMLTQQTNHLSDTFPILVDCFQQTILLVVSLLYLVYLSKTAFLVFAAVVLVGILWYLRIDKTFRSTLQQAAARQAQLLDAVGDIIHGSKELRLNSRKSAAVMAAYRNLSQEAGTLLAAAGEHWAAVIALGFVVTYFILGVVVFVLPSFDHLGAGTTLFQLIPIVLFCLSPLSRIVEQSAMFVQADVELQSIFAVERQLESGDIASPSEARALATTFDHFTTIAYSGITFSFRDTAGAPVFTSGPWDLTLKRGETVFLVGGNGSGKSTVLRLVVGLYRPDTGRVAVDGAIVEGRAIAGLREQFSAIFGDFHLFDRLYGLEHVDPQKVNRLIGDMWLTGKVRFEDGRFTDLNLSTGQRKRLALIVAQLEDRQIYAFDEWSAEQDALFREEFYRRVLPKLKAEGKTVVAVTHDERFWHLADRVIRFDLGRVAWERTGAELAKNRDGDVGVE